MPYYSMLKLNQLPKEEFSMLKQLVIDLELPQETTAQVYADLLCCLLHLAYDISAMRNGHIQDGQAYLKRIVGEVLGGER